MINPGKSKDSAAQPLLIHNNGIENINSSKETEEYTWDLADIVGSSDDAIISQ